jgi:hypothetical protein
VQALCGKGKTAKGTEYGLPQKNERPFDAVLFSLENIFFQENPEKHVVCDKQPDSS